MPRLIRRRRITIEEAILELTKRGAGMTTLFLLVTEVCQSLNELGVVSVTKKWSGQKRTSRTACYGPGVGMAWEIWKGGVAGSGWECRSGSGLVVLEVFEGRNLLEGAGSAGVGVAW